MYDIVVRYRQSQIDGRTIFYREAGDPQSPTVVLLHGFPSSSHMFRDLMPALADRYHLIAPDHLGFGGSSMPTIEEYAYSFEGLAEVTARFLDGLGLDRYALYVQDYGAPIGLRVAAAAPQRVSALIVQNGNAYVEGFTPFWELLFAYARDRERHEAEVRKLLNIDATRFQYTDGVPADRLDRVSPDNWVVDQAGLDRPGNKEVQLQLLWDYQFNIAAYPAFHDYFRRCQPPTLITWGRHDQMFGVGGAHAYLQDLPDAELHLLDAGHFALESHGPEITQLIRTFLDRIR